MVEPALGEILLNELDRIFQDEGGFISSFFSF